MQYAERSDSVGAMQVTLRDLRKAQGLTQNALATMSGVSPRTIKRAEAGHRMSIDTIVALAPHLQVPILDLVEANRER